MSYLYVPFKKSLSSSVVAPLRCSKVSQSLLQAVLQPFEHFCCPTLDSLKQVHIFLMLGAQNWMQQSSRVSQGRQSHLPHPGCHTAHAVAQGIADFLGCECALLRFVRLFGHQNHQSPFL